MGEEELTNPIRSALQVLATSFVMLCLYQAALGLTASRDNLLDDSFPLLLAATQSIAATTGYFIGVAVLKRRIRQTGKETRDHATQGRQ